jgi:hypothetical protein
MMTCNAARKTWVAFSYAGALSIASLSVAAADDDWQYSGTLYFWAAGIKGETARGAEVDVGFDTLLENLNMTFMGALEAKRGRWSLLADVVYLNVGANDAGTVPVPVQPGAVAQVDVSASVKSRGWVISLLGAYNVLATPQASLDVLAGARYMELSLGFDLRAEGPLRSVAKDVSAMETSWDGVVGIKGHVNLSDRWYLPYYVDVGTGQSDLTWQAFGGVGYSFDWGDVSLVYRKIAGELDSDSKLDNIDYSGPVLSATWRF